MTQRIEATCLESPMDRGAWRATVRRVTKSGAGMKQPHTRPKSQSLSSVGKESTSVRETWVRSLGWEDPLEKGKATSAALKGEFQGLGASRPSRLPAL